MTPQGETSLNARAEALQFVRFLALGGCAAAVNWLSRFPLERLMGFSAAVAMAYMIGMAVAFALFRRFVFPASDQPLERQVKFFILVNLAGIAQVWAVSMALVYYAFPAVGFISPLAEPLGHGIAIGVPTISSYFGHRLLTFQPS
ncbi:GtrA family protein [Methylocystis sp. H62]|uniref:GtrA family protein n=1 Tax=Methylocystis sp. H62 TaxID=2785789 RepID=UPI0018C2A138|nr:GtrA family protein [Methylocystis sp. H62]MBG0792658.1 GtrA family protein [Methylocystis sp. H62]